jgi:hypothetical protein
MGMRLMPGPDGRLTLEERQKFAEWLNRHFKNQRCDICQSVNWGIGEHLLHGQIFTGGGLVIGGATYPQAFIACGTCYHVKLFMAAPIGIADMKGNAFANTGLGSSSPKGGGGV